MKAIFLYSDGSIRHLKFPSMMGVRQKVNDKLTVEPILVYFDGKLSPDGEGSVIICKEFTRWQHWCLRQTRSYEV